MMMTMVHVLPDDRMCDVRLEDGDRVLRPQDFRGLSDGARAYDLRRIFALIARKTGMVYISTGSHIFNRGSVADLFRAAAMAAGEVGLDVYTSENFCGPYERGFVE